mmetsp:Transcript_14186/g.48898  ORF Transcript_14186/g.48898 Transcript_14186/m.48898 type:complete len:322 (+) Transcript_14186:205-1170(+)
MSQPGSTLCAGWLKKKKARKTTLLGSWTKRWFMLSADALTYSEGPKAVVTRGAYALRELQRSTVTGDKEFTLEFPERTLVLRAQSTAELDRWSGLLDELLGASRGGAAGSTLAAKAALPGGRQSHSPTSPLDRPQSGLAGAMPGYESDSPVAAAPAGGPPSPRSLLARPAAVGSFFADGAQVVAHAAEEETEVAAFSEPESEADSPVRAIGQARAPWEESPEPTLGTTSAVPRVAAGAASNAAAAAAAKPEAAGADWDNWDSDDEEALNAGAVPLAAPKAAAALPAAATTHASPASPQAPANPALQSDAGWLEEDWDSDEE